MRTLQECIDLFNSSLYNNQYMAVKQMEQIGEWATAAIYWRKIRHIEDAEACELIVTSTAMGDLFREKVKHLNDFVDNATENGIMSKEDAIKIVTPQLKEYYNQTFK